jgi:hemolysin III
MRNLLFGTLIAFGACVAAIALVYGAAPATTLAAVWSVALAGITIKLLWPGCFDKMSIALYPTMGWSDWWCTLLHGVVFHVWTSLRFQNAIWHLFVLAAAGRGFQYFIRCC